MRVSRGRGGAAGLVEEKASQFPGQAASAEPPGKGSYFHASRISKSFGETAVLRQVSLEMAKGELLCLLGPSGCGKSTLLNIIAGVLPPDTGAVILDGTDITAVPLQRRDIGFVFQNYALFPHMTVEQNVGYGLRARHVPRDQIRTRVGELLRLVDLHERGRRKPAQLSGGEQQRVALARALAISPDLLLLDEPFSNLDAALRTELRGELRRIQGETAVTMIMVTHDQAEAFEVADRIALIQAGQIIQLGTPRELYEAPGSEFAARFLGEANILTGRVVPTADMRRGIEYGGITMPAPDDIDSAARPSFVVRPEHVVLSGPARTMPGQLRGRIRSVQYRGTGSRYVVDVEANGRVDAVIAWDEPHPGDVERRAGDEVAVSWSPAHVHALPSAPDAGRDSHDHD